MPDKRVCIGKISSAHGIKGLVKILPYCEDLSLLSGKLHTEETGDKTINITPKNQAGKYIISKIDGVENPEDAKLLKYSLYVSRESLPNIEDKDSFYIEDLKGLNAFDTNNKNIGVIKDIPNFGAGNLIEIQPNIGASFFVPFQDEYIDNIDLKERTIVLINPDSFKIE